MRKTVNMTKNDKQGDDCVVACMAKVSNVTIQHLFIQGQSSKLLLIKIFLEISHTYNYLYYVETNQYYISKSLFNSVKKVHF